MTRVLHAASCPPEISDTTRPTHLPASGGAPWELSLLTKGLPPVLGESSANARDIPARGLNLLVGDLPLPVAGVLDGHRAAHDDPRAEGDVTAHRQPLRLHERRRPRREARLEVAHELEVVGVKLHERRGGVVALRRDGDGTVVVQDVGVGAQRQQVVGRLDGREALARHADRARAVEDVDRGAHRGLELDDRGRRRVAGVDRLAVDDHRKSEHAIALLEHAGQLQELIAGATGATVRVDINERDLAGL